MKKSKLDKAMEECQEVMYSVLVQYLKEDNEDNTNDNTKR